MVFRNCLGMIMSVSTLIIGSGAATPVRPVNFCIGSIPAEAGPRPDAGRRSELVRIAGRDRAGALDLAVLDPLQGVAVLGDLPAHLGIGAVLEAHGVAVDRPLAGVALALDRAVLVVELGVGAGAFHLS